METLPLHIQFLVNMWGTHALYPHTSHKIPGECKNCWIKTHVPWTLGFPGTEAAYRISIKLLPWITNNTVARTGKYQEIHHYGVSFLLIYQEFLPRQSLYDRKLKSKITKFLYTAQISDLVLNATQKKGIAGKRTLEGEMLKITKKIHMPEG